ncbi:hypothetical protein M1B74_13525 [Bacteroides pyogenes]|uniref:hypothetical protein n=1 Tax=Bacteroides pyogenes TaxID=310300 RepID=UPI003B438D54
MKKNVFKSLLTMCALGAIFAACSNEGNEVPDAKKGEKKTVFMKLDLNQKPQTKATEDEIANGTVATVTSLHIYFYDDATKNIQKYLKVDGSTTPSITTLTTTGAQIPDVPAIADKVLVRGNVPSGISLPTGGSITTVENQLIDITTQNDKSNILLGHIAVSIQTYNSGGGAAPIVGMQNGDKYAEVTLIPAVARIQIEGLQAQGTVINGFKLEGIYLTNFYEKLKMGDGTSSVQTQYGANASKYEQNAPGTIYTTANAGKLYDKFSPALTASGSPWAVTPNPSTKRWAYHAFENTATTANKQLQLVFKLSNVTTAPASGVTFPAGTPQFLTVRGFKDNLGNIVKLEKGKIYTISKADFKFDESNLTTVPNTDAVGVWLKVTVKPWTVVAVKPNL